MRREGRGRRPHLQRAIPLNAITAGRRNRAQVLEVIQRSGPVSRPFLVQSTGLTPGTISNAVRDLVRLGLVRDTGRFAPRVKSAAGAPSPLVALDGSWHRVLSIHQGVSRILVGGHDLAGHVLAALELPVRRGEAAAEAVRRMTAGARRLVADQGWTADQVRGIGVGAVGLVDVDAGAVRAAPNLGWADVPIRDLLESALGWPVVVHNNVHAMARGEQRFAGLEEVDAVYVYVGYGIGSGLLTGGRIFRGAHGAAGEIGHLEVASGGPCTCGKTGCLETVAAEPAIAGRARRLDGKWARGDKEAVGELVRQAPKRPECAALLTDAARALGWALAQVCEVFDPGVIVVNGIVAEAGAAFLEPLGAALRDATFAAHTREIAVRRASFGRQAGMIGAAAMALDAFVYSPEADLLIERKRQPA